jgi:predicted RNA-binding protein associated with RNAse of E/G family
VSQPAHITPTHIVSIDVELDLFVSPDCQQVLRLDVDEFEARNYQHTNPDIYQHGWRALEQLESLVHTRQFPFVTE